LEYLEIVENHKMSVGRPTGPAYTSWQATLENDVYHSSGFADVCKYYKETGGLFLIPWPNLMSVIYFNNVIDFTAE
jgi:hypothetical protein